MRFVHTADWQLGMTRYFLNGEAQPRYSAARRDVVAALGALAGRHRRRVRRRRRRRFRAQPTRAARRQPVAGGHACHRRPRVPATRKPRSARCVVGVHQSAVHRRVARQRDCPGSAGCARGAARAATRSGAVDVEGAVRRPRSPQCSTIYPPTESARIVVGHGGVDILVPDKERPSLIRLAALEAAIARGAVHYVALGDKHSRMQVGSTGRIWYSGRA